VTGGHLSSAVAAAEFHPASSGNPLATVEGIVVPLTAPVRLQPAIVAKPWGREIWFTGIERRGESRVVAGSRELPLSTYLNAAAQHVCGGMPPVLLKILEPRPEPFAGDLYFERHEHKHEVYVVDGIDEGAHPTARSLVRLGVNQALRRQLGDAAFRRAFLEVLERFEQARLAADAGTSGPDEAAARAAVLAFTGTTPIAVGDTVAVPAGHPHSLQHGVRVVEFQTPVYERQIIYATQRVLTQRRWDSAEAVGRMHLEPLPAPQPDRGCLGLTQLAASPGFTVCRLRLEKRTAWTDPGRRAYVVCLLRRGAARIGSGAHPVDLDPGEAAFVPGSAGALQVRAAAASELLLAFPGELSR
jgi:hypothetical protein